MPGELGKSADFDFLSPGQSNNLNPDGDDD
jgi:hypothetical protein